MLQMLGTLYLLMDSLPLVRCPSSAPLKVLTIGPLPCTAGFLALFISVPAWQWGFLSQTPWDFLRLFPMPAVTGRVCWDRIGEKRRYLLGISSNERKGGGAELGSVGSWTVMGASQSLGGPWGIKSERYSQELSPVWLKVLGPFIPILLSVLMRVVPGRVPPWGRWLSAARWTLKELRVEGCLFGDS